jgi:hypothetical protein
MKRASQRTGEGSNDEPIQSGVWYKDWKEGVGMRCVKKGRAGV